MNKTKLREEIQDYQTKNNAFAVFNIREKDGRTFYIETMTRS